MNSGSASSAFPFNKACFNSCYVQISKTQINVPLHLDDSRASYRVCLFDTSGSFHSAAKNFKITIQLRLCILAGQLGYLIPSSMPGVCLQASFPAELFLDNLWREDESTPRDPHNSGSSSRVPVDVWVPWPRLARRRRSPWGLNPLWPPISSTTIPLRAGQIYLHPDV